MFKNVASQKITLLAIDTAANLPKTGDAANITAYVSKDDGTVTVLGDTSATELDSTNAPGLYAFDLTQSETNADKLVFSAKSSTSGVRIVPMTTYTLPNRFTTLVIDAAGLADANAVKVGPSGSGTAQTAGDIPARLPAALTANGNMKSSLVEILTTALTETTGQIAAAFKKWFDVPTPVGTVNSIPNATAGATGGLAIVGSQMDLKDSPNATSITAINAAVLTAISNLNNLSALANLYGSPLLEIPDSSSTAFAFTLVVRDNEGKLVDLDSNPTIAAANAGGTDRSANLSAVSHPATGRYTFTYTVASNAAEESLRITCSGSVSAESRYVEWIGAVVNYDSLTQIAAIKAKTDNLPTDPADQSSVEAAITAAQGVVTAAIAALNNLSSADAQSAAAAALTAYDPPTNTEMEARTLTAASYATASALSTLAGKFTGITLMSEWLGLLAGKQTGNTTARTELRATGAGSGTFDETTDSMQAIRDRGDAAWTTGGGGGGGNTVIVTPTVGVVTPDTTDTEIRCKVGATNPKTVAVFDANLDPVDLTALGDLVLCIETLRNADVQVVEDDDITISGADDNQFTFTPDAATVASKRTLKWSLRRVTDKYVILQGSLVVDYSPLEDE